MNDVIHHIFGKDTRLANIISFALSLIQVAFTDLFFIIFLASQELMDTSNVQMMIMKPLYTQSSLVWGMILSKLTVNLLLVFTVHLISAKFITVYEGHTIGVISIYFICAYEFTVNVLVTLGNILDLQTVNLNRLDH